jgi:hypothetical protein
LDLPRKKSLSRFGRAVAPEAVLALARLPVPAKIDHHQAIIARLEAEIAQDQQIGTINCTLEEIAVPGR